MRLIDVQYRDSRPTADGQAEQARPVPEEVALPALAARIEEHDDTSGLGVTATQVAGFREVAVVARPCEHVGIVSAPMFLGENVLDVERKERKIVLMQSAILAALSGARTDQR